MVGSSQDHGGLISHGLGSALWSLARSELFGSSDQGRLDAVDCKVGIFQLEFIGLVQFETRSEIENEIGFKVSDGNVSRSRKGISQEEVGSGIVHDDADVESVAERCIFDEDVTRFEMLRHLLKEAIEEMGRQILALLIKLDR